MFVAASSAVRGSSPLARGAQAATPRAGATVGLIPARAGSTSPAHQGSRTTWAHPRSRGEHCIPLVGDGIRKGSSPLARGAPTGSASSCAMTWLIPARAGSTPRHQGDSAPGAHPRSRGEHPGSSRTSFLRAGSSPLARGALARHAVVRRRDRLIPARAGSTFREADAARRHGAHPRSRGEHSMICPRVGWSRGSSPLARGAQAEADLQRGRGRLIPARAGSTFCRSSSSRLARAHPRSRGEHMNFTGRTDWVAGSSPLARGAPFVRRGLGGWRGLIPARAGSTRR